VKTASEMTYCVSGGALNSTHSLTDAAVDVVCRGNAVFGSASVTSKSPTGAELSVDAAQLV